MNKEYAERTANQLFNLEFLYPLEEAFDQKENRRSMRATRIFGIWLGFFLYLIHIWLILHPGHAKPGFLYGIEAGFLIVFITLLPALSGVGGPFVLRSWARAHGFINIPLQVLYLFLTTVVFQYILLIPSLFVFMVPYEFITHRIPVASGSYLDQLSFMEISLQGLTFLLEKENYLITLAIPLLWFILYFSNYTLPAIIGMDFSNNAHLEKRYLRRDEFDAFVLRGDMSASSYGADFYSRRFLINRIRDTVAENYVNERLDPSFVPPSDPPDQPPGDLKVKKTSETYINKQAPPTGHPAPEVKSNGNPGSPRGGRHNRY